VISGCQKKKVEAPLLDALITVLWCRGNTGSQIKLNINRSGARYGFDSRQSLEQPRQIFFSFILRLFFLCFSWGSSCGFGTNSESLLFILNTHHYNTRPFWISKYSTREISAQGERPAGKIPPSVDLVKAG
jgi:hypothetical protein